MNYIGSKNQLSAFIKDTISNEIGKELSHFVFCDLFAGTGIVGRTFKPLVKTVIANDFEYYSYVLNKNYIGNHKAIKNQAAYIKKLNDVKPTAGFIYKNYCLGSGSQRQYFSDENGKKIDAVRMKIEQWKQQNKIDDSAYFFLLASLIESADKVANTASVYGAYLKKLKKSAQKELILSPAEFDLSKNENEVYNEDSNVLIEKIKGDILYLDPPYNARQYGANYHLLNTIAKYDKFIPKGKTGLRDYRKSDYCSRAKVKNSFEDLIKKARFRHIFLSYNNEGLMSDGDIKEIMSRYGKYKVVTKQYRRFKADKDENRKHLSKNTEEFLHILHKN